MIRAISHVLSMSSSLRFATRYRIFSHDEPDDPIRSEWLAFAEVAGPLSPNSAPPPKRGRRTLSELCEYEKDNCRNGDSRNVMLVGRRGWGR